MSRLHLGAPVTLESRSHSGKSLIQITFPDFLTIPATYLAHGPLRLQIGDDQLNGARGNHYSSDIWFNAPPIVDHRLLWSQLILRFGNHRRKARGLSLPPGKRGSLVYQTILINILPTLIDRSFYLSFVFALNPTTTPKTQQYVPSGIGSVGRRLQKCKVTTVATVGPKERPRAKMRPYPATPFTAPLYIFS
jgi:hypothetical protein